jgi:putative serine protease PepD
VNPELPPLPPRPNRGDGELPPIAPRPSNRDGLPRIEQVPPPLPKRDLRPDPSLGRTEQLPRIPREPRRSRRTALIASGVLLTAGVAGAVSAHVFAPETKTATAPAATQQPVSTSGTGAEMALESAVQRTAPSVVEVKTDVGQGSGVIVQPTGLIITNAHVVGSATTVEVINSSGTSMSAEVLTSDEFQDLAVLRPAGNPGPGVEIVDDSVGPPNIGSSVFAIGSPFGLQNTVTAGVVSAFRGEQGRPLIQFDAPVNPGNSGGGLFDLEGRLIGIPTAIRSPISGNVGIAFAVPSSRVRAILAQVS